MSDAHDIAAEPAVLPTERNFGLTVGGILLGGPLVLMLIGRPFGWAFGIAMAIGAVLVVLALVAPRALAVPNRLWGKLGEILFTVANPIVMALVFLTTFLPIGLYLRLSGRRPYADGFDRAATSYWVDRKGDGKASDFTKQY